MSIPLFLAMTASEFFQNGENPQNLAWMSAHFSPSDSGLSNLPPALPTGSILILDDQIPWTDHDMERVCQELTRVLLRDKAYGLLLDFEREPCEQTLLLASAAAQCCREIGCAIAMPEVYRGDGDAACFLPPLPCTVPVDTVNLPRGPIWLDAAPTGAVARIGSEAVSITHADPGELALLAKTHSVFRDPTLGCRYYSYRSGEEVVVSLFDTPGTVWEKLEQLPIELAIAAWRETAAFETSELLLAER